MLKGKKIILRAIERKDLKYFVKWLNDEFKNDRKNLLCHLLLVR